MPSSLLPQIDYPDIRGGLAAYGQAYGVGKDMRAENALSQAGTALTEGDQTGARNALYAGGQVQEGLKLEGHFRQTAREATADQLAKAQRSNEVIGNLALSVKQLPPERQAAAWGVAIDAGRKAGLDVDKYADPAMIDYVLAQGKKTGDWLNMEAERRKQESDAVLKRETIQARSATAQRPRPRNLSFGDTQKLAKQGVQLEAVKRYGDTFKDEFSGYGRGGETTMFIARNLPLFTGPTTESAATWWQDYDRYKNVVRNELFGSALTEGEQRAFESADITPNMDPKQIRANLARQKSATESALAKTTRSLTASGYSPDAVEGAIGLPLEELKVGDKDQGQLPKEAGAPTSKEVMQVRSKQEYDALPPGTRYIAPDGSIRTKQ